MNILVVDDQEYNRELIGSVLEDYGHDVLYGVNGQEACENIDRFPDIDLIFMDVVMPVMDGLEATTIIKSKIGDRFLPIVFITALDNEDGLTACFEAGGDDFIPKPVNENILIYKVNALKRSKMLYDNLANANKELEYHRTMINREHSIVDHIFTQIGKRSENYCENFQVYTSPMSMFNGDLVLTAASPSGGAYGIVGDFTGHGLAAAIGSLPVSEIFHQNVINQASISQLASDINKRLKHLLPSSMFFCAALFEIDYLGRSLTLWMGGMNDLLLMDKNESSLTKIQSSHLPLGILSEQEFDDSPKLIDLEAFSRAYICTDGVIEAENPQGEQFGEDRLESVLHKNKNNTVSALIDEVNKFAEKDTLNDDVSIVEINIGEIVHRSRETEDVVDIGRDYHKVQSVPWDLNITLKDDELRSTSLVNQVMAFVSSIQGIELHQDKIFTIVSELYSNSLEHGVLGLNSSLKESADGFEEYYRQRERGLENLHGHYININFKYVKGEPNCVELKIEDSGKGFDINAIDKKLDENEESHGRGLHLLKSLCSKLEYSDGGCGVFAVYELTRH